MKWLINTGRVFANEWRIMLHDPALLIFFVVLPLAYPIVYTLIYNKEIVRKINIAVVDDCRSEESRDLVRMASATPSVDIYGYASDMAQAKEMWAEREVYGILHIPSDYSKNLNTLTPAHATLYCDMSLLLRYRTLLQSMTALRIQHVEDITAARDSKLGLTQVGGLPIDSQSNFLGDPQQGFASFVMPGIVVLILQQSMILGIAILGGGVRERRRHNGGIDPLGVPGAGMWTTVWGKALAYTLFYVPVSIYILHYIPEFFHLPHYGSAVDYLLFIFPMLLATAFLGQAVVIFIREREYVFLVVVFVSVVFLFLSGLIWPRYAMHPLLQIIGNFIPATWGVEGFVRINSNTATLAQNSMPYIALWIQVGCYCILAALITKYLVKHNN